MDSVIDFFRKREVRRVIIFGLILLMLFSLRSMMNFILLTFIFSFLMNGLVKFTLKHIKINRTLLVLLMYALIVSLLTIGVVKYLPIITMEISQLIGYISNFSIESYDHPIFRYIESIITSNELTSYLQDGFSFLLKSLSDISNFSVQVLIALVLSLFFLIEKPRLINFTNQFKNSKVAPFYYEIEYFGSKFSRTFGKVIEAQFIIALINTFLTACILLLLGFPQIFGLSFMVFFLGLIPVAGVIISLIPLSLIAFTLGGFLKVFYLLIGIMVIHAIEAYILNPKLMSSKTNLPVFYTFVVLIFSQHFFGVWGLIIGIPVFVFLLDVLGVKAKKAI